MRDTPLLNEGNNRVMATSFDGHAATLHLPRAGQPYRAVVVIVPPVGRDRIWTYRALYEWANLLAQHGYVALRYDPWDEGDSCFLGSDQELVSKWLEGVEQASSFARQICGEQELVLCGLRIGATFASKQSSTIRPSALVLWDPLPSGQHWVRELKMGVMMVKEAHPRPDGIEINGLHLPPDSLERLERLDLSDNSGASCPTLLSSPGATKKMLKALGPQVDQVPFTGYADLFKDSHSGKTPWQLFKETLGWLDAKFPVRESVAALGALPRPVLFDGSWREERVEFGLGLMGVLCEPVNSTPKRSVIFCSTSANTRSGDGNFTTRACRALAERDIVTLRFDLSGYGESPAYSGADLHVYETSRTAELNEAARFLKERGYSWIAVAGVCAGGYHAFRALMESNEFYQALPINALIRWTPGTQLSRTEHVETIRTFYLKIPAQLRQYMRFRHKIWNFVKRNSILIKRILPPSRPVKAVRDEIQGALQHNKRLDLIVWDEDMAMESISEFGPKGRWLAKQPGVGLTFVQEIDHAVVVRHSQDVVIAELLRALEHEAGEAQSQDPVDVKRRPFNKVRP
jgi:hypothetical protein